MKKNQANYLIIIFLITCLPFYAQNNKVINLSGKWNFKLDKLDQGEKENWYMKTLPLEIKLPGSTDEAKYGKKHKNGENLYYGKPEIWQLAREYVYIGKAWYQKTFDIPKGWNKKEVILTLERTMWQSKVWVNNQFIDEQHSLCTPNRFDVTQYLKTGKNKITIQINNSPFVHLGTWSHGYAPGIQTIWNGIVGKIELKTSSPNIFKNIQCFPSFQNKNIIIKGTSNAKNLTKRKRKIAFKLYDDNKHLIYSTRYKKLDLRNHLEYIIDLKDTKIKSWDEFHPNLYTLKIAYGKNEDDTEEFKIGFRDIKVDNGRISINGQKIFLRGEHDAGSFPLTGYPSMEENDWIKIFKLGKAYGLNHWRFHSWCPPEAAFSAADKIGIYLQPELPLFSQDWEHTLIGQDEKRDAFLFSELKRIINTYGNHPSFLIMCMGNELRGNSDVLEEWVKWTKKRDQRHFYAGSANLEAMGKYLPLKGDDIQVSHAASVNHRRYERRMCQYFNSEIPNTAKNYSHTLNDPYDKIPIIVHELGQWTVYPDFKEIKKYTGVLKARNFEIFKSRLQQKGMLALADKFVYSSGKLAALLYKEEMERTLRTPHLSGFQLLDLRDYQAQGSALVGLLNAFWESKGVISAAEFKASCNDITLLAEMPKRVWENNEKFNAQIVIPNYSNKDFKNQSMNWEIKNQNNIVASGVLKSLMLKQGEANNCGSISLALTPINKATQLTLHLHSSSLKINNEYSIWVYPKKLKQSLYDDILVTDSLSTSLINKIKDGKKVLYVPKEKAGLERMEFTTPFWSTILFDYQPKTLGLLCNPSHPLFKNFPTDSYSNWQWWGLTHDSYCFRLNNTEHSYLPILQIIDHPVRNDKLGAIIETKIGKGALVACSFDIVNELNKRPVARQLRYSILNYMESSDFSPKENKGILEILLNLKESNAFKTCLSEDESPEQPISFAFDKDNRTSGKLIFKNQKAKIKLELHKQRYIKGCAFLSNPNKDISFKVYVYNKDKEHGKAIISSEDINNKTYSARQWDNGFTIQTGKKGKYIELIFETKSEVKSIDLKEVKFIFGD